MDAANYATNIVRAPKIPCGTFTRFRGRYGGVAHRFNQGEKYIIDRTRSSGSGQSHRTLREQAIYNICLRSLRVEALAALRPARIATGDLF
jgi:hypothetical protein